MHEMKIQTPPPAPPLEERGVVATMLDAGTPRTLPSLQGEGLGVGSVVLGSYQVIIINDLMN